MKFGRLQLTNFTVFKDVTFDFCPGINVLIGANGTGKSHVLKASYAIQKTWDESVRKHAADENLIRSHFVKFIWSSLYDIFGAKPPDLIRYQPALIPSAGLRIEGKVDVCGDPGVLSLANPEDKREMRIVFSPTQISPSDCLFLPTREFLASFEGFAAAYSKRELAFDRTYSDLCVALSASDLKGSSAVWGEQVIGALESALPGEVELKDGKFYVDKRQAFLVAEGHRKLAMLVKLLRNGGISANTTLYWDEPESGLNPKLIKIIANALMTLAANGVQITIATHDYLLTYELSLAVEYQTAKVPVQFYCLSRESPADPVTVQSGQTLAELDHNPILEEFTALYEREQSLYYGAHPASATRGEP